MDEDVSALIQELVNMLAEARWEIGALRQVIVDQKLATEQEIDLRIQDVKLTDQRDVTQISARLAFEKLLKARKVQ